MTDTAARVFLPKVYLLSGCARGIGWHLLQCLAQRGERVVATDIEIEKLCGLVSEKGWPETQIIAQGLDVRKPEQWESAVSLAVEKFGRLDVLINIAGVTLARPIHEASYDQIDFHMDINAKGMIYGAHAASKVMVGQKSGHIISFASLAALAPVPYMSLYSASKFAVRGFSHAIATDLAPHGVAVTVVCPDAVDTPMLAEEAEEEYSTYSFAGNGILSVQDIEKVIFNKVLPKRPREVLISGPTGFLMRWVSAYPALFNPLLPIFERQGRKTREAFNRKREKGL